LVFPDQLKYAAELVAKFPDQPFVLDHIAKPDVKNKTSMIGRLTYKSWQLMKMYTVKYPVW
jgi:hypothetical protein